MCPEHRYGNSHECPVDEEGNVFTCVNIALCPTCSLKKHPDHKEALEKAKKQSSLFSPSLDTQMKQFGIYDQGQQADVLQSLLLHVASSYDPEKTSQIAQENYSLTKRDRSPSPPKSQVIDLTSLSYDELVAAENSLKEELERVKKAKLEVQFQQPQSKPSLGRRAMSDGDLNK